MELLWEVPPAPTGAAELARQLGVSPIVAALLIARGEDDGARDFLLPRLARLRPPETMAGLTETVERLAAALADGSLIGVFGDFDVDGVTSAALVTSYLRACGGRVVARVGRRASGYGLTTADATELAEAGCRLVVACDCGTADHAAVALLAERGVATLIIDHHEAPEVPAEATALVNPQQPSCRFPFKDLAAVGVAFYVCAALRTALRRSGAPSAPSVPDPREWLDLVAIGTIADVVPLRQENRILVHHGLQALTRGRRPGLRALADLAGVATMRAEAVAFRLAPRLNAPGRLGDAAPALELLLEERLEEARSLATECDKANRTRQQLQEAVFAEATAQIEAAPRQAPLVVAAAQGWNPGVVGIVATKLVERYGVPAVVVALDGDQGRGSARTIPGFHLFNALRRCADHLVRYGGHAAAAGLTVKADALGDFQTALEEVTRETFPDGPPPRRLAIDLELPLEEVTLDLCRELTRLEPFGHGHREPLFVTRGLRVVGQRVVGTRQEHLALTLGDSGRELRAIGFGLASRAPATGALVDVAHTPFRDDYRGTPTVQLRLRDLRPSHQVPERLGPSSTEEP